MTVRPKSRPIKSGFGLLALSLGVAGVLAIAANAGADADPTQFTYRAGMNGAKEVPGPGDPNGSGKAVVTVDTVTGEVCYELQVRAW